MSTTKLKTMRTLISELVDDIQEGQVVTGYVCAIRTHGKISFIDISDRSATKQFIIANPEILPTLYSFVRCEVLLRPHDEGLEFEIKQMELLAAPNIPYPFNLSRIKIDKQKDGGINIDTLLEHRPVSLRNQNIISVFLVTSDVIRSISTFLRDRGFVEVKTPKLVGSGTEGGTGLFEVKYFDRIAFLAQSPQLYKQCLVSTPLERVFEIGPVFRAERHATSRHLNEFISVDIEMAYPENLKELIQLEIDLIRHLILDIRINRGFEIDIPKIPVNFPSLDLQDAKEIATGRKTSRTNPAVDLTAEEETILGKWAREEYGSDVVCVHSYPVGKRPFYTLPKPDQRKTESYSYTRTYPGRHLSLQFP